MKKLLNRISNNEKNKGITLISLIVTVIVLLILAGISIRALMGDNGLISASKEAKEDSIINNEKESIDLNYIKCQGKNTYSDIILAEDLQNEMIKDGNDVIVEQSGNNLIITFNETKHEYTLLQDGSVELGRIEDVEIIEKYKVTVKMSEKKKVTQNGEVQYVDVGEEGVIGGTIEIYSDASCSTKVSTVEIQKAEGEEIQLTAGKYYVKIITCPVSYGLINEVTECSVVGDQENVWSIGITKGEIIPESGGLFVCSVTYNDERDNEINIRAIREGINVTGLKIACYKVGEMQDGSITPVDAFTAYPIDWSIENSKNIAEQLTAYINHDKIPNLRGMVTDDNGECIFMNLEDGIYLFTTNKPQKIDNEVYNTESILINVGP